ncbi:hypothetical protein CJD44_04485 [Streptomyces sp. alain-838]|nr:hypothetical protein [Streptomyces sp. alain-838]PAK27353.1 hypothetical protein CJD44_04485 [Streptomyces sp. alain-838]
MTTLKVAKETSDRHGRPRSDDPNTLVHAYDVESGAFPFHEHGAIGDDTKYDVLPDIDWKRSLLPGLRCMTCQEGASPARRT